MEHLKRLYRYFKLDMVSTLFLCVTIFLFVYLLSNGTDKDNVGYWLGAVIIFIFRGIIWQGAYVDRIRDLESQIELTNKLFKSKE
jgi:uncharacterized membrane protein YiaA